MSPARNRFLAILFFTIYTLLYAGFMLINVLAPDWMELTPVAGVNVAIWYGFGLILAAVVLAFLYGSLCLSSATNVSGQTPAEKGGQK